MEELYLIHVTMKYCVINEPAKVEAQGFKPVVCKGLEGVKKYFTDPKNELKMTSPTTAESAEPWYGSGGYERRWCEYTAQKAEVIPDEEKSQHGHWVHGTCLNGDRYCRCSECDESAGYDNYGNLEESDFCPNCGAEMDEECEEDQST